LKQKEKKEKMNYLRKMKRKTRIEKGHPLKGKEKTKQKFNNN